MLARLVSVVSEECRADSGVSAPGPGAGGDGEPGTTCGNSSETTQGGGRRGERGAGRDRCGDGFNITSPQLLFGGVSLDHKP